jgi:hypothetical protein
LQPTPYSSCWLISLLSAAHVCVCVCVCVCVACVHIKRIMAGKPRARPVAAAGDALVLEAKSPAEFFANNKTLTGFDNPAKALYTTVRELVENALDATEAARVAPTITVTVYARAPGGPLRTRTQTGTQTYVGLDRDLPLLSLCVWLLCGC